MAGFPVKIERESGDKELRADPYSSQVNAGNIDLLRGEWIPGTPRLFDACRCAD
jgi:phage terminase large subunit-like protein